jgi:hypothetical protein
MISRATLGKKRLKAEFAWSNRDITGRKWCISRPKMIRALVGGQGVGPCATALSERPRHRLSRRQRKVRVSSPTAARAVTGVQSPLPRRRRTFQSGERRCRAPRCYPSPAFEAGCSAGCALSMSAVPPGVSRREMAEDGVFETHPAGPPGFRPGPAAWLVHPPWRKAENSNLTELPAHRLAGEPGTLAGSPSVPFPGFEPGRHPPKGCGSASWPRRACE